MSKKSTEMKYVGISETVSVRFPFRTPLLVWKHQGVMYLQKPRQCIYAASEQQYNAAGEVQVPWGCIYEWR